MELVEFILSNIAADEAVARAAIERNGAEWTTYDLDRDGWRIEGTTSEGNPRSYTDERQLWDDEGAMGMFPETAQFVVRHDPARVLAECAAHKAIVEEFVARDDDVDLMLGPSTLRQREWNGLRLALRALASVYAGSDGWREEWS